MAATLDQATRVLLDGKNFATVATLNPDGGPHTSVVWIGRDGDTVVFSTTAGRRKARNLARDPRISITIFDTANPYRTTPRRSAAPPNWPKTRRSHCRRPYRVNTSAKTRRPSPPRSSA